MLAALVAIDPEPWVRDNSPLVALLVLVLVALLVARMVVRTFTRVLALAVLAALALVISAERQEIQRCGQTCECELVGATVTMPLCRSNFPGDGG